MRWDAVEDDVNQIVICHPCVGIEPVDVDGMYIGVYIQAV